MTHATTEKEIPAEEKNKALESLHNIVVNMNMMVAGPAPTWVVKFKNGSYFRMTGGPGGLAVSNQRLATRFDSLVWADSWVTMMPKEKGAKAKRLWTKTERELLKAMQEPPKTFTYKAGEPSPNPASSVTFDGITRRKNTDEQGGGYSAWVNGVPATGTGETEDKAIYSLTVLLKDFVIGHRLSIKNQDELIQAQRNSIKSQNETILSQNRTIQELNTECNKLRSRIVGGTGA